MALHRKIKNIDKAASSGAAVAKAASTPPSSDSTPGTSVRKVILEKTPASDGSPVPGVAVLKDSSPAPASASASAAAAKPKTPEPKPPSQLDRLRSLKSKVDGEKPASSGVDAAPSQPAVSQTDIDKDGKKKKKKKKKNRVSKSEKKRRKERREALGITPIVFDSPPAVSQTETSQVSQTETAQATQTEVVSQVAMGWLRKLQPTDVVMNESQVSEADDDDNLLDLGQDEDVQMEDVPRESSEKFQSLTPSDKVKAQSDTWGTPPSQSPSPVMKPSSPPLVDMDTFKSAAAAAASKSKSGEPFSPKSPVSIFSQLAKGQLPSPSPLTPPEACAKSAVFSSGRRISPASMSPASEPSPPQRKPAIPKSVDQSEPSPPPRKPAVLKSSPQTSSPQSSSPPTRKPAIPKNPKSSLREVVLLQRQVSQQQSVVDAIPSGIPPIGSPPVVTEAPAAGGAPAARGRDAIPRRGDERDRDRDRGGDRDGKQDRSRSRRKDHADKKEGRSRPRTAPRSEADSERFFIMKVSGCPANYNHRASVKMIKKQCLEACNGLKHASAAEDGWLPLGYGDVESVMKAMKLLHLYTFHVDNKPTFVGKVSLKCAYSPLTQVRVDAFLEEQKAKEQTQNDAVSTERGVNMPGTAAASSGSPKGPVVQAPEVSPPRISPKSSPRVSPRTSPGVSKMDVDPDSSAAKSPKQQESDRDLTSPDKKSYKLPEELSLGSASADFPKWSAKRSQSPSRPVQRGRFHTSLFERIDVLKALPPVSAEEARKLYRHRVELHTQGKLNKDEITSWRLPEVLTRPIPKRPPSPRGGANAHPLADSSDGESSRERRNQEEEREFIERQERMLNDPVGERRRLEMEQYREEQKRKAEFVESRNVRGRWGSRQEELRRGLRRKSSNDSQSQYNEELNALTAEELEEELALKDAKPHVGARNEFTPRNAAIVASSSASATLSSAMAASSEGVCVKICGIAKDSKKSVHNYIEQAGIVADIKRLSPRNPDDSFDAWFATRFLANEAALKLRELKCEAYELDDDGNIMPISGLSAKEAAAVVRAAEQSSKAEEAKQQLKKEKRAGPKLDFNQAKALKEYIRERLLSKDRTLSNKKKQQNFERLREMAEDSRSKIENRVQSEMRKKKCARINGYEVRCRRKILYGEIRLGKYVISNLYMYESSLFN